MSAQSERSLGEGREPLDLLVVGSGVAGLFAALCAAPEARVRLVTKGPLLSSASFWAQGGVAAALGEDDAPALHAADTHAAGRGLCAPGAVEALTLEAPARIRDLVDLGTPFDEGLGLVAATAAGGSSMRPAPRPAR
ncbi:MAG: FAD-dependent oxidoreductase [Thermoleophilia bacterium]